MTLTQTKAVVIPVYNSGSSDYLDTLVRRHSDLTTLIYGWQGKDSSKDPARMVTPGKLRVCPHLS